MSDAETTARLFHDTYERLAPSFGYETRKDTKQFDPTTPNGRLMIAVCGEILITIAKERDEAVERAKRYQQSWLEGARMWLHAEHHKLIEENERLLGIIQQTRPYVKAAADANAISGWASNSARVLGLIDSAGRKES